MTSSDIPDPSTPLNKFKSSGLIKEAAVWYAFAANVLIALIKFFCFLLTKSSAMLSEAIHSLSDSINSVCLLVGLKRGSRPADKFHHFGYGLETNVWALIASILMFIGSIVSFRSGWERFFSFHEAGDLLEHFHIIIIALVLSFIFEIMAVHKACSAVLEELEVESKNFLRDFFVAGKNILKVESPTTKYVFFEDTAALLGVILVMVAMLVAKYFVPQYAHIPDAIASLCVAVILLFLSLYLAKNNIYTLTGASAKPHIISKVKKLASLVPEVHKLHEITSIDMGSSGVLVNMEIEVNPDIQVKEADDIADKVENLIMQEIPEISHVTIEFQANAADEHWGREFENLIETGKKNNILNIYSSLLLKNVYKFTTMTVEEVMIPRTDMVCHSIEEGVDSLINRIIETGYSRIPVYTETIDDIIGVVNAKDVLKAKHLQNGDVDLKKIIRKVPIVPENKSLLDLLKEMIGKKTQIVLVADEHGGISGIVTIEDILEEIVGEIWDEYDVQIPQVIRVDPNSVSLYSKVPIDDINERFGLNLPEDEFQTIGGFTFGLLGRRPVVGDRVTYNDFQLKVEALDGHKIVRVLLTKEDGLVDKTLQGEE